MLWDKRCHRSETPTHCSQGGGPARGKERRPLHSSEDLVQPNININFKFKKNNGSVMKSKKKLKIPETSLLGLLAKIKCKKVPRYKYNDHTTYEIQQKQS